MEELKYAELPYFEEEEVYTAIKEKDENKLAVIPFSVGEYYTDRRLAQKICLLLSEYNKPLVRANAVMGLAYIARNHSRLDRELVLPILKREYFDNEEYRGTIDDAISDILFYLKWETPSWYEQS